MGSMVDIVIPTSIRMPREPMLASKPNKAKGGIEHMLKGLRYPILLSPKIDGIRMHNPNGQALSRKLLRIQNKHTYNTFSLPELIGLDGELAAGKPWEPNLMQLTGSATSDRDSKPLVDWYVFDDFSGGFNVPFEKRLERAAQRVKQQAAKGVPVKFVAHSLAHNRDQLLEYEHKCLTQGYEGVMGRDPIGPYKDGRSTLIQGWLLALKREQDFDAIVTGVVEMQANNNDATTDERGYTKRSSHKANKTGKGTLGALECIRLPDGVPFSVGGGHGLTTEMRDVLWEMRDRLPGCIVKCVGIPHGEKDKPRHPRMRAKEADFIAIRPDFDVPKEYNHLLRKE